MKLRASLSAYWLNIQASLFPWLQEELGELTAKQQQLVTTLDVIRLEEHISSYFRWPGRPKSDRVAIGRSFVAKAVFNSSSTKMLRERMLSDPSTRRICGWEKRSDVPSEATFSRAFAEFAQSSLPKKVHLALIDTTHRQLLVGHMSRDSTKITAREKPTRKPKQKKKKKKRGRPRMDEQPKVQSKPTRLERQLNEYTLPEMLADLPKVCDVGTKKNSKGYKESWIGYKLHIDAADGQIPISCVLTSASVHDSQVAIPLAEITAQRTTNLYDLMDSAYDAPEIKEHSKRLNHVPIIDVNPRRDKQLKTELLAETRRQKMLHLPHPERVRYRERSTVERVNGRLKDEFGCRKIMVKGHQKVMCHLMFGVLALTADQLMKFVM